MAGGSTGEPGRAGGEFALRPWELHGEGREFERIGGELAKAVTALEQGLAALGAPWGTDRPGSGFAAVYGPARGELVGGLRGVAGRVAGVGAGLHTMAARTADADSSAASGFGATAVPEAAGAPGVPGVPGVPGPAGVPGATPGAAPVVPQDMSV
ncbi:hypothetical protein [Streptomyces sp. CBMA156]|uniref:hypothetical protein n=1 Tax=Streptomyces sp. CBMA156 TaxID=1930280 RepID=UPI001661D1A7|nr:hypothetical protein [Streptomyces sp. CBMA156]MBD0671565.1 hypothetical protein [Streptomyces sp. CBMA156]